MIKVNIPYRGAWSSLSRDQHQWLQVDFYGRYTRVTGVATQGRNSSATDQWVTKYKLSFSEDGEDFQYFKEQGQIKVKNKVVGSLSNDDGLKSVFRSSHTVSHHVMVLSLKNLP